MSYRRRLITKLGAIGRRLHLFQDRRPICAACGIGRLNVIGEEPDTSPGADGAMWDVLQCDNAACSLTAVRQRCPR